MLRSLCAAISILAAAAANPPSVKGTFVVGGADAKLSHVRVLQGELDGAKGKPGYTIILTEKPSSAPVQSWRIAEPGKTGSFIWMQLEPTGAVWVADLGHAKAKSGRFSVVTEVSAKDFKVAGGRLSAHITTNGQQTFTQDSYAIDLTIDAPIERK
jgi:hypothetical protein